MNTKSEIIKLCLIILLLFQGQRYEHVTIYLNTMSCLVLFPFIDNI